MSENETSEKKEDLIKLTELLKDTGMDKKSHKQLLTETKLSQLLKFQESFLNNQMKRMNEKAFIVFNSNIINECRNICSSIETTSLSKKETVCLKNCFSKFYHEVNILRKVEVEMINSFGTDIYLHSEEEKNVVKDIFKIIEKTRSDQYQSNLKV